MNRRLPFAGSLTLACLMHVQHVHAEEAAAPEPPPNEPTPDPVAPTPAPAAPTLDPATSAPATFNPLKLESAGGNSIKLGILLQPQYQALSSPTLNGYSQNLFLRRTRILVGGTLLGVIDYFVDTDYPNLFLSSNVAGEMGAPNTSVKAAPGMNIQDAFATYKGLGDVFKVDAGFMLPPMSHNAVQGAGTLYSWDYFSYTFQHTNSFLTSAPPVGRDVGVQLRGLVLDGHLEYRAGLFQGLRNAQTATDVGSRNFFRATGRVQVNLLDAEPGFFYAGTYLGTKKIASLGAAFDVQSGYKYFALDGIVDLPLGPGVATAQVNLAHWDGGTFIPALVKQTALMGEAGYAFSAVHLSPIVRIEHLSGSGALANQSRYGAGVGFWPYGHNSNLKAFYTRTQTSGAPRGFDQFNLQWQVYFY